MDPLSTRTMTKQNKTVMDNNKKNNNNNKNNNKRTKNPHNHVLILICAVVTIIHYIARFNNNSSIISRYMVEILNAHQQEQHISSQQQKQNGQGQQQDEQEHQQSEEKQSSIQENTKMGNHHPSLTSIAETPIRQQESTIINNDIISTRGQEKVVENNKTIVILMGNLRCGEKAWTTLYKNVLDINHADLALIVGDTLPEYANSTLFDRAKYIWRFDEYDDWADALDLINGSEWRTTVLPQLSSKALRGGLLGGVNGTPSSGAIQGMVKWWLKQHIEEDGLLDQYDYFAVTRTDQYYSCPLPFDKLRGLDHTIFIPWGESYSGYCDRFYVTGKSQILASLDILPQLLNQYDPNVYGKLHNPEGLLKTSWQRKNLHVKYFQRMMFTCASAEVEDISRWKNPNNESIVSQGVIRKYSKEYDISQKFCSHYKDFMGIQIG